MLASIILNNQQPVPPPPPAASPQPPEEQFGGSIVDPDAYVRWWEEQYGRLDEELEENLRARRVLDAVREALFDRERRRAPGARAEVVAVSASLAVAGVPARVEALDAPSVVAVDSSTARASAEDVVAGQAAAETPTGAGVADAGADVRVDAVDGSVRVLGDDLDGDVG